MKVLVFGGSFDPPHAGHQALLRAAVRRIRPDKTLVVPAWRAPLKGRPEASPAQRLALCRRAFPGATIDQSELRARRPVYTVETLRRLAKPGVDLHFLVGSDSAASFHRWKEPHELRRLATWWTAKRPGRWGRVPAFFKVLPDRMPELSSTLLRQLKAGLKPGRYAHTLAVARLAVELARRWGQDEDKARLAALLHDAGRMLPIPALIKAARSAPLWAETARRDPILLHAYASEKLAKARYGVSDREVLRAVRQHTLGGRVMGPLDRLLYVADACSQDRRYPGVAALRKLAFEDLDAAFQRCVAQKLEHALSAGRWLHPATVELWNSLAGT